MHSKNFGTTSEQGPQATEPWVWFIAVTWFTAVVCMLWVLWSFDHKAGADAATPPEPAYTVEVAAADRPTLLLVSLPAHGEPDRHAAIVIGRPILTSSD